MNNSERKKTIDDWGTGAITTIVATDAFGLGVDLIVRHVIMVGLPSSIQTLWQRGGRAGRDNKPANVTVYWSWADLQNLGWMTQGKDDGKIVAEVGAFEKMIR